MRATFRIPLHIAPNEMLAPGALDGVVGRRVRLTTPTSVYMSQITGVEQEDAHITLTLDVPTIEGDWADQLGKIDFLDDG